MASKRNCEGLVTETGKISNSENRGGRLSVLSPLFASRPLLATTLLLFVALVLLPIISLTGIALSGNFESFSKIASTVLWPSTWRTIKLLTGVAILTATMGTTSAWLIAFYDFPARRFLNWALMLPLAVPTYISAYAYVEFAGYTGPVQSAIRAIGGYKTPRDYWFPEIRSLEGTIIILSVVLYPYVYLSVRTLFHLQSRSLLESARILGVGQIGVFRRVLLPLARPAIVLGVTLALMESINDIGAIEYLGTRTLTYSIFTVWLNRDDMAGAAQLSLMLLAIALVLIIAERWARKSHLMHESRTSGMKNHDQPVKLHGRLALAAFFACSLPLALGFFIPVTVLLEFAITYWNGTINPLLVESIGTSITLASLGAFFTVFAGLLIAYAMRVMPSTGTTLLARLATLGYAIPGTIVALGIFMPIARFDNSVSSMVNATFGFNTGLLITGSGATIVFAYMVRFLAMSEGTLDSAMRKLSPRLDQAARSLGKTEFQTFRIVLLPILWPAIASAGLFVFIDSMKELSATILLRPAGINTISTYIYDFASRSRVEEAAFASLVIVAIGIIPVLLVSRNFSRK